MPQERVFVLSVSKYRFLTNHISKLRRDNHSLSKKLAHTEGERAKAQHKLEAEAEAESCEVCHTPPTVTFIHCHHTYCGRCALQGAGRALRCYICEDLNTIRLAAFYGQTLKHDGRGWMATWGDSENNMVRYTSADEDVTDVEEEDEPEGDGNLTEIEDEDDEVEVEAPEPELIIVD